MYTCTVVVHCITMFKITTNEQRCSVVVCHCVCELLEVAVHVYACVRACEAIEVVQ